MAIPSVNTQEDVVALLNDCYKYKPSLLKIEPSLWKYAIRSVLRGDNLLIQGDSGFGKTYLATTLAEVFERPFFPFNLGATQDARSYLIGNTFYEPSRGTYVAESYFVKAIQTPNAIILLDEVSRAHPDAHNILMTVLDKKQKYLRIDERPDTPTITVADGVTFLGTANVGAEYTATRTIDRAFLDRWSILLMPHLTGEQEVDLLTELYPALPMDTIAAISEIACLTRDEVKKDNPSIDTVISTRVTTEIAGLMCDGFTLQEAAEIKIYPFYSPVGGAQSQQTFMKQVVNKYITVAGKAKKNPYTPNTPMPTGQLPTPDQLNGGRVAPWD